MSISKSPTLLGNLNNKLDILEISRHKLSFYYDIIQKTHVHINRNKKLGILTNTDINKSNEMINQIMDRLNELNNKLSELAIDNIINTLQIINNELSNLLKIYGTQSLDDFISICFGTSNNLIETNEDLEKYNILKRYFHPLSYKVVNKNMVKKEIGVAIVTDNTNEMKCIECLDIGNESTDFHMKVYGLKIYFYYKNNGKYLCVYGIVDEVNSRLLHEEYFINKKKKFLEQKPQDNTVFITNIYDRFLESLSLKDYLLYDDEQISNVYIGNLTENKLLVKKPLVNLTKEFINGSLYNKRNTLIQLLVFSEKQESKYISYLLYDLLSNDTNNEMDTIEQVILLDSLPISVRTFFNDAMKETIKYTNELTSFDMNKIPLEQQICLMKVDDNVKEKAMVKLKELKAKSEDSGSKARQYLDGLLKIPFGIYNREPIMEILKKQKEQLTKLLSFLHEKDMFKDINIRDNYVCSEIQTTCEIINKKLVKNTYNDDLKTNITSYVFDGKKEDTIKKILNIYQIINDLNILENTISPQGKTKAQLKKILNTILTNIDNDILGKINTKIESENYECEVIQVDSILTNIRKVPEYMNNVKEILDKSVHGHDKAKKQIEKIIGQWINGKQDGYCFGFEGAPGIGKTSLAKHGLSKCLLDEEGNSRPFSMIAIGGDANGSTLHGHNYTYVGSSWGGIVQILMDKKCMNPIIFIDELDKISRTENGREIIGILTHLLDPTQNDSFQDKYFYGINLDLSKALFVLAYNDVDAIDKILLDRIHRIKFSNLSLEEKLYITQHYIIPEVCGKMGLDNMVKMDDDVVRFVIETYTIEPGVRKLKEQIFDIIGELNLKLLKEKSDNYEYPINITKDDIKNIYLKDKPEVKIKQVCKENRIGHANGMWANAMGQGGTLPIEANYYPSEQFMSLKLTGMQGDVMKESMNVALTIAYRMTNEKRQKELCKKYNDKQKWGVHLHTPAASDPKNGPSAGSCITSVIYSLLNDLKIKYNFALTGEITLDGSVTAIGGLDLKILGSIKAGITHFIYPDENKKEFDEFMDKYKDKEVIEGIEFYPVTHIKEVFELIFE